MSLTEFVALLAIAGLGIGIPLLASDSQRRLWVRLMGVTLTASSTAILLFLGAALTWSYLFPPSTLTAVYREMPPSIDIAPRSEIYVVNLTLSGKPQGFQTVINNTGAPEQWPNGIRLILICQCDIHNFGDDDLLNVDVMLQTAYGDGSGGKAYACIKQRVSIPAIRAKSTFTFYIINYSKLFTWTTYPRHAVVHIAGSSRLRDMTIGREAANETDKDARCMLPPVIK